jgi:hypothetical protein
LHNSVLPGKTHAGYAVGWFFGIRANYQAAAAVWGWGGPLGVKLPEPLCRELESRQVVVGGQATNLLELLRRYRDYSQFRNDRGEWDRELLRYTLLARSLAARYLLMNEDSVVHADQTVNNPQPPGIQTQLRPEDFHPGESWATYFGRKADEETQRADEEARLRQEADRRADEEARRADEEARLRKEADRRADEANRHARQLIALLRQQGHSDEEIAADLGATLEEIQQRYPRTS